MTALVIRRVIRLVVVLAGVSLVTFAILQVSGDPVALMMPEAPESDRALLREAIEDGCQCHCCGPPDEWYRRVRKALGEER